MAISVVDWWDSRVLDLLEINPQQAGELWITNSPIPRENKYQISDDTCVSWRLDGFLLGPAKVIEGVNDQEWMIKNGIVGVYRNPLNPYPGIRYSFLSGNYRYSKIEACMNDKMNDKIKV